MHILPLRTQRSVPNTGRQVENSLRSQLSQQDCKYTLVCMASSRQFRKKPSHVQDTFARKLAAHADHRIHTHASEIYGTGFHRALRSYELLGSLEKVVEHLRKHMDLPVSAATVALLRQK